MGGVYSMLHPQGRRVLQGPPEPSMRCSGDTRPSVAWEELEVRQGSWVNSRHKSTFGLSATGALASTPLHHDQFPRKARPGGVHRANGPALDGPETARPGSTPPRPSIRAAFLKESAPRGLRAHPDSPLRDCPWDLA